MILVGPPHFDFQIIPKLLIYLSRDRPPCMSVGSILLLADFNKHPTTIHELSMPLSLFSPWCILTVALNALCSLQAVTPNATHFCLSPLVNPSAACWDHLNVTGYLDHWWAENEEKCDAYPYSGSGFASCFQQLHGDFNSYCNSISIGYRIPNQFSPHKAQEYYVLQSMYNLWYWYTSVWFATAPAVLQVELQASQIVQTINPVHPGDTSLGVLLSALSAGFAFLGLPAGFGTVGSKFAATAVGQSPGLAKGLLPSGSLNSEFTQLAEIETALERVMEIFQDNLVDTLNATMYDYNNFRAFVEGGAFISEKDGILNASVATLKSTLSTFIVS